MHSRPRRRFLYRLALALGRHDVDELAAELTPDQLDEWAAYYQVEPWDNRSLLAQVCETVDRKITEAICCTTGTRYDAKYHGTIDDYLMGHRPPKKPQTPADMVRVLKWQL